MAGWAAPELQRAARIQRTADKWTDPDIAAGLVVPDIRHCDSAALAVRTDCSGLERLVVAAAAHNANIASSYKTYWRLLRRLRSTRDR